jgi:hypothetical protein
VLDCNFVEGAKCHEKIFCLSAINLVLEGGSSALYVDLLSGVECDSVA